MNAVLSPPKHFCYADYLRWPNNVRCELIDGEIYDMSPAPDLAHQDVAGEIYLQVRQALKGKSCRVFIAPVDVLLPKQNEADELVDTIVQPDVLVVCDSSKLDRRGVRGAPDWIVEVLSPSTARHDQIKKRSLYEKSGVREYWLVHPTDRMLTVYQLQSGEYGKPELYELQGQTPVAVLPGVVIVWDELLELLPNN